jgi:hypothetical protein
MKHLIHLLFLLISLAASAAEFQPDVGVIAAENKPVDIKSTTLDGNVIHRMVAIGQPIYLNDEINTGPDNKVQVLLKDKTAFNLGSNASIIVDKFVFNIEKPELSVNVKKGVFKFVSGKISDMKKDSMKVSIPNAVIAIRGTSVAGSVNSDGSANVVLIHGAIGIQGPQNSVEITKSGYGSQITSGGLVNPPVAIPASTIKAITTQAADSANATQSSVAPIQTNQAFSDSSGNTTNFNNYQMTTTDYQNLQQTAATRGSSAAAVEFFKLLGVDINAFDINYAFAKLSPELKIELIKLTKGDYKDYLIVHVQPFDNTILPYDSSNTSQRDYVASKINSLTIDSFKEPYPKINEMQGPVGAITFNYIDAIQTSDHKYNVDISQNVTIDFTKPGGSITNQYSISNIPSGYGFNLPTYRDRGMYIEGAPASITFSQLKIMANTNDIFYLPTDKVSDGSQLLMTTSIRLNTLSKLILSEPQSSQNPSTVNAAWGLFGNYLISPTGQVLFGTKQVIGNVSRK